MNTCLGCLQQEVFTPLDNVNSSFGTPPSVILDPSLRRLNTLREPGITDRVNTIICVWSSSSRGIHVTYFSLLPERFVVPLDRHGEWHVVSVLELMETAVSRKP